MGVNNLGMASYKRLPQLVAGIILFAIFIWRSGEFNPSSSTGTVVSSTPSVITEQISPSTAPLPVAAVTSTNAVVIRVVDGDTLVAKMDGQENEIKVRMLGINTPESVDPRRPVQCFGKEASNYLKTLIEGKRVRLDPDLQADDHDKYGRALRNVVREDGMDVNATMVKEGYAVAYLSFPLNKQRKAQLKRLQTEAEVAQRGLWNPLTCDGKK